MSLDNRLVIIGMINGMIGGVILVQPLLSLQSGVASTVIVLSISALYNYYSCRICLKHLGSELDLDSALLKHFNNSKFISVFYDFIVFLNLLLILVLYFQLIVQQWEGLLPNFKQNDISNAGLLFVLVFVLKYFEFGASVLAYGALSIVGYCIFLIWMLATSPSGNNTMPIFGSGTINMAASMGQALSIQPFFIPLLRKNNKPQNYLLYVLIAYLIGPSLYLYISYAGAYGLLNRQPAKTNPQTVQDYFHHGYWELYCLQIIYLIHLYSVFPQFLLVSKKRIFGVLGLTGTDKGLIPIPQIIYAFMVIALCFAINTQGINVNVLIQINGAVIGFFFIYFLPLIMHIKCLYFPKSHSEQNLIKKEIQIGSIDNISQQNNNLQTNLILRQRKQSLNSIKYIQQPPIFICPAKKQSIPLQILDIIMLIGMMSTGGFILVSGIIALANG